MTTKYETAIEVKGSVEDAYNGWVEYVWKQGGGVGMRPSIVELGEDKGKGCTRR